MAHAVHPAHTPETRRSDALSVIALAALACIAASVVSPSLLGTELTYTAGAAVVVGIGAVVCFWLTTRPTRVAAACVVLGLVTFRTASAALPDLFLRPHGVPSPLDSAGLLLMLAAAAASLLIASTRR